MLKVGILFASQIYDRLKLFVILLVDVESIFSQVFPHDLSCVRYRRGILLGMSRALTMADRGCERRWIIVVPDGRFSTLDRTSGPSEAEILSAEEALRAQGLAGWLAVMEGNPYIGAPPRLLEVRPLADPTSSFAEASAACIRAVMAGRTQLAN
jgi:hypothetical protein